MLGVPPSKVTSVLEAAAEIFSVDFDAISGASVVKKAESQLAVLALSLTARQLETDTDAILGQQCQTDASNKGKGANKKDLMAVAIHQVRKAKVPNSSHYTSPPPASASFNFFVLR